MSDHTGQPDSPIRFDALKASAQAILQRYWQTDVALTQADLLTDPEWRSRVWRVRIQVQQPVKSVPTHVIIKQIAPANYAPEQADNFDTQRFFGEWAGALFLNGLGERQHGPRFYGGDHAAGFVVLEDIGEPRSLVQPLLDGDMASAAQALRAYTQRLGEMHADTYGREAEFDAICRSLHPHMPEMRNDSLEEFQHKTKQRLEAINATLRSLEMPLGDAALNEAQALLFAAHRPTQFRTFIHSDPCPDNVIYDGGTLRLIDFEFVRYGHALHDGLFSRIPFPTCWCSKRVPDALVSELETQYRQIFGAVCPPILDDDVFRAEVCIMAGRWAIETLIEVAGVLKEDREWGIIGLRARILTRLETFTQLADQTGQWPALHAACRHIHHGLQRLWPDADGQPVYPAFLAR